MQRPFYEKFRLLVFLIGGWLSLSPEWVQANLLLNGGFEDPVLASGTAQNFVSGQAIGGGWTVLGNPDTNVVLVQTAYIETPSGFLQQFNAQEGLNSLDLTGASNQGLSVGVRQTVVTTPGLAYTLSFFVGRATPDSGALDPYANPATVDLSIDGGAQMSFTNSDITDGIINWKQFSYAFTATGLSTTIDFFNGTLEGTNEAGLDNVSLVAAVPEPSTLALLSLSMFGLHFYTRRRWK